MQRSMSKVLQLCVGLEDKLIQARELEKIWNLQHSLKGLLSVGAGGDGCVLTWPAEPGRAAQAHPESRLPGQEGAS